MANHILRKLLIALSICAGVILLLFIAFYLMVEYGGKWSEEERQRFAEECTKTATIDGLGFVFMGFKHHEVDSVLIKQIHQNVCIDSFYIHVSNESYNYDHIRQQYGASIDKPMVIADTYHIVVPNIQTFVLSDMEMVMWPQYTMMSEGWGCRMGSYTIDGVRFEHDSNPTFVKEGYVWP